MGRTCRHGLLCDVGHLADAQLPHNEASNDDQAMAPGGMTPGAATPAPPPFGAESGSPAETAAWATEQKRPQPG
jgi:hypothetical protein